MLGKWQKPVIIRIPVIPGYNDDMQELSDISELLTQIPSVKRIDILPYHRFGVNKYDQIGLEYTIPENTKLDPQKQEAIVAMFSEKGFSTQIGG